MIPVFTTSRPGFMGDTSDRNQIFIKAMEGERKMEGFPKNRFLRLYIDGTLEDEVGFDIPIWLSGTITTAERQPCLVWDVEGKRLFDATITLRQNSKTRLISEGQGEHFFGGLITLPYEEREYIG